MTKAERLSASRRKKAADPGQQQKSGAAKPTYVRTDSKKKMKEETAMQDNNLYGDAYAGLKKKIGSKKKHNKPAVEEGIMQLVRGKKKEEKKPEKAMDAGARARRKVARRVHAKYVSGSEDLVPDNIREGDVHSGQGEKIQKRTKAWMDKKGMKGAPGLDAMKARTAEHQAKRGVKEEIVTEADPRLAYYQSGITDASRVKGRVGKAVDKVKDKVKKVLGKKDKVSSHLDRYRFQSGLDNYLKSKVKKEEVVTEEDKKGKGSGTKDACYHKVKASAKVWPSAYASGRLVQCRKKGAANYGKSKNEGFENWVSDPILEKVAAWQRKEGKNKEGGLNEKGRKSYERENPGSDLKAPQPEGGSRKKSFCARMGGMKKKLTSKKTANDPDSRINKALRKWKC